MSAEEIFNNTLNKLKNLDVEKTNKHTIIYMYYLIAIHSFAILFFLTYLFNLTLNTRAIKLALDCKSKCKREKVSYSIYYKYIIFIILAITLLVGLGGVLYFMFQAIELVKETIEINRNEPTDDVKNFVGVQSINTQQQKRCGKFISNFSIYLFVEFGILWIISGAYLKNNNLLPIPVNTIVRFILFMIFLANFAALVLLSLTTNEHNRIEIALSKWTNILNYPTDIP